MRGGLSKGETKDEKRKIKETKRKCLTNVGEFGIIKAQIIFGGTSNGRKSISTHRTCA